MAFSATISTRVRQPDDLSEPDTLVTVAGRPACLIQPSPDAPSNFGLGPIAEIDVLAPHPLPGGMGIVVVTGDAKHVASIASSLEFPST